MQGYVAIYRKLQEHWIWQDDKYLRYWLTILLNVNHTAAKFPVNGQLYDCLPGESFRSIQSWSDLFGCSKKTTIKFFSMLETSEMITRKTIGKGNRRKHLLTLVNWHEYQKNGNGNSTERKPETPPKGNSNVPPNKNGINDINDINDKRESEHFVRHALNLRCASFREEVFKHSNYDKNMLQSFFDYWTEPNRSKTKLRFELEKTWDTKRRLNTWSNRNKEFNSSNNTPQYEKL